MGKSVVDQALQDTLAMTIVAKTSRGVSDILETLADGRVVVYGDRSHASRATRTEIRILGALVVVHKNTNVAEGMFAAAACFSELEVVVGEQTHALRIIPDPRTSGFNPIYLFFEGNKKIGTGYGQQMDLRLASELLEEYVGGVSDRVPPEVVEWIRGKIS